MGYLVCGPCWLREQQTFRVLGKRTNTLRIALSHVVCRSFPIRQVGGKLWHTLKPGRLVVIFWRRQRLDIYSSARVLFSFAPLQLLYLAISFFVFSLFRRCRCCRCRPHLQLPHLLVWVFTVSSFRLHLFTPTETVLMTCFRALGR